MTDSQPNGNSSNDSRQPTPQYGQYANPQQNAQQQDAPVPQYGQQSTQPEYGQYANEHVPQQPPQTPQYGQPAYGQYAPQRQNPYGQPQPAQPQPGVPPQPSNAQYGQYGQYGQQAPANPFAPGYQPQYGQPQNPYAQRNPYTQPMPGQPLPQGAPAYAYAAEPPIDQPWYGIKFGAAIARLFRKAFVWTGRASRGEFWWAFLFIWLIGVAVSIVIAPLGGVGTVITYVWQVIADVLLLFAGIRRLHDTNRSGWFMLIPAIATALDTLVAVSYVNPISDQLMIAVTGGDAALEHFIATRTEALAIIGVSSIVILIAMIISIVLLAGRSKPEGARFDVRA